MAEQRLQKIFRKSETFFVVEVYYECKGSERDPMKRFKKEEKQ